MTYKEYKAKLEKIECELKKMFFELFSQYFHCRIDDRKFDFQLDITKEESKYYFLMFLEYMLGKEYADSAKKIYEENKVCVGKESQVVCKDGTYFMEIDYKSHLHDVSVLSHEFGHMLSHQNNFTTFVLGETIPIFLENLSADFMKMKQPDTKEMYIQQYQRFLNNYHRVVNYIDSLQTEPSLCFLAHDIPYVFSSVCAVQLYRRYFEDEQNFKEVFQTCISAFQTDDMTKLFQTLQIPMRYENETLICDAKTFERIVNDYFCYYEERIQYAKMVPIVTKRKKIKEWVKKKTRF